MSSRREFLQKITASAAVLPLLSSEGQANPEKKPGKPHDGPILRVAILGLGSYGSRVALHRNLPPGKANMVFLKRIAITTKRWIVSKTILISMRFTSLHLIPCIALLRKE
jgi:hypothetical protein